MRIPIDRGLAVGFAVAGLLWGSHAVATTEASRHRALFEARAYPPLLIGRLVSLEEYSHQSVSTSRIAVRPRCELVVALDDSCAFCRSERDHWADVFQPLSVPAARLTVVTFRGLSLAQALLSVAVSHFGESRILSVDNLEAFPIVTGIGATPTSVLLDASRRVLTSKEGSLRDKEGGSLLSALRSCGDVTN